MAKANSRKPAKALPREKKAGKRGPAKAATSRKPPSKSSARKPAKAQGSSTPPPLLSGGNPQIAKADGDAPVQAYIAAMSGGGPGWKRDIGRRLDALVVRTLPPERGLRKAVKWNSPFYGIQSEDLPAVGGRKSKVSWFLSFHCFARYVKVAFFQGASLRPLPPGESKQKDVRYLDIYENDTIDEDLVANWIRQASELPGWVM
jgi:hypothetical protein